MGGKGDKGANTKNGAQRDSRRGRHPVQWL